MNDKRRQKVKGRQEMKSVTHKGYVKWYSFGKHAVPNYRHEIKIVAPTWIQYKVVPTVSINFHTAFHNFHSFYVISEHIAVFRMWAEPAVRGG